MEHYGYWARSFAKLRRWKNTGQFVSAAEYLTYIASVGDCSQEVEILHEDEKIWFAQRMMALFYNVGVRTVNEHINNIYKDSELLDSATGNSENYRFNFIPKR